MAMDQDTIERKSAANKKAAFDKWLDEPMVRMGLSMIPAGEHQDTLRMLLQSAFDAGHTSGGGSMLGSFLEAMLTKKPPGRLGDTD